MIAEHHTARRYEVRHRTEYCYADDVTTSFARAFLTPRATAHQQVLEHRVEVTPEVDVHEVHVDLFGNNSHYLEIHTPHRLLSVRKVSVVEVAWPWIDLSAITMTVGQAASRMVTDPDLDQVERAAYLLPSKLVDLSRAVREFGLSLVWPQRHLGEAIEAVYHRIYADFSYRKGATNTKTTLPEIIAARTGVCQDFAHLAVACFRAQGIPARYVSGYIETAPPPGKPKLEGSDATHAWASVYVPGVGWVDLDPTNNHLADSRYIVTGWGRDFRDVSPLKGVIFTESAESTLEVAVDVIRLDDPAS